MVLWALLLLAVYVGAVVWLTWPLGARITESVPGSSPLTITDILYSMWAMGWTGHALVTAPFELPNANIYHPTPHALFYGPSAFGGLPLFAPVFWTTRNPVLASNVTFLGGVALTAWTTHLVVRRWTASELAGMVAAATILANAWLVHGFVAATPHMAALQYLPLIALAAATPAARLRDAAPLLLLIVVQSLTDSVYVAPAVIAVVATVALIRFARRDTRAAAMRLVVVLALAALAIAPVYAGYARVRRENPDLAHQSVYWAKPLPQYLPGQFLDPRTGPAVFLPPTIALVALGLAALAARRWRAGPAPALAGWRHGALWTVVGIVISLSPQVWWGRRRVPVPQMLLAPIYAHLRAPARLGVVAMVGAALLAGMAFAELARWLERPGRPRPLVTLARTVLAAAAIGSLYVAAQPAAFEVYPLARPDPVVLQAVREIPGPIVEISVPRDWAHGLAMYDSLFHWRPLLNGYSSYYPSGFRARMTLVRQLPEPDALASLRADTGLAAVWVHLDGVSPAERVSWLRVAGSDRRDLVLVTRRANDLLFRVQAAESDPR